MAKTLHHIFGNHNFGKSFGFLLLESCTDILVGVLGFSISVLITALQYCASQDQPLTFNAATNIMYFFAICTDLRIMNIKYTKTKRKTRLSNLLQLKVCGLSSCVENTKRLRTSLKLGAEGDQFAVLWLQVLIQLQQNEHLGMPVLDVWGSLLQPEQGVPGC